VSGKDAHANGVAVGLIEEIGYAGVLLAIPDEGGFMQHPPLADNAFLLS
jgi:hypothetical protein